MQEISKPDLLVVIIAVVGFLVAMMLYLSRKNKRDRKEKSHLDIGIGRSKLYESQLRNKLVNMVFGDQKAASRLIEMERGRTPYASEKDLIRNAIERIERDRR